MLKSRIFAAPLRVVPGLLGLAVVLLGAGEVWAENVRVGFNCKPEIRYDKTVKKMILYNSSCPVAPCVGQSGTYVCQDFTVPSGTYAGYTACGCPAAGGMHHSCILAYQSTGVQHGGRDVVNAGCYDLCDTSTCPMTSGSGPSPWPVYCASCPDP